MSYIVDSTIFWPAESCAGKSAMSTSNPQTETAANAPAESRPSNFIRDIILDDL
jgi:hypothetical protein